MIKVISFIMMFTLLVSLQANGNELKLYGLAHLSIDSVDDGQSSSIYTASNSSRLGFSGDFKLESDLKVIFQYESGVDLTAKGGNDGNGGADSSGQIFTKGRTSFLGLSGSFGKILVGHMPALDQWANDYNLFADQIGDLGNLWEASGIPGRLDDVIYYSTPKFGRFDLGLTYKPEQGQKGTEHVIFKANYSWNQFRLITTLAQIGQGTGSNDDHSAVAVTFDYRASNWSIGGGIQNESDITGVSGQDRKSYYLGGSLDATEQGTFKLQFASSQGEGANNDTTLFAVGYDYKLGKSTKIYIAYSNMENDTNVDFSVNGKGHGDKVVPNLGEDPRALSLGIVYEFGHLLSD